MAAVNHNAARKEQLPSGCQAYAQQGYQRLPVKHYLGLPYAHYCAPTFAEVHAASEVKLQHTTWQLTR